MNRRPFFPKIVVTGKSPKWEAVAGLKMDSILPAGLFFNDRSREPNQQTMMQQHREAFLSAISSWPDTVTLELALVSMPRLENRTQGLVSIHLLLRGRGFTEQEAKESVASKYIVLKPLLSALFSEADFRPIVGDREICSTLYPFRPKHCLSIHRRHEEICLSAPFKRRPIGLLAEAGQSEGEVRPVRHCYPWEPSCDDWAGLLHLLLNLLDPVRVLVRVRGARIQDQQRRRLEGTIQSCERCLKLGDPSQLTLQLQAETIRNATLKHLADLTGCAFRLGVFIFSPHPVDPTVGAVLGDAIAARQNSDMRGGFAVSDVDPDKAADADYFFERESFSLRESACAFRLPSPPAQDHYGLPVRRSRTGLAMQKGFEHPIESSATVRLFVNTHNGLDQPIQLEAADRLRHLFVVGQTGCGKTTFMESLVLQDIRAGRGVAVIDPHGDMVDSILGRIPREREEDVILFDVLDRKRPLGFNILQWSTLEERDLIIDSIYHSISYLYDLKQCGGPWYESNMRGMLSLLMGDKIRDDFRPTILEFTSCYLHKDFRSWLSQRSSDPLVLDFLSELERCGGEGQIDNLSPYITSKFSRFTNDTTLRHIIGQERTSFSFDEIMNTGKIFLVNLAKGRFGSTVSALLANQLVSRFRNAAMKRGEMRPDQRRDFYLYVDECHHLPAETFTELLSEARKFGLSLTLATQFTGQIAGENQKSNLLSAIHGNVGTLTIFRLGSEDARVMSPALVPYFSELDIIGLPNWEGYARLQPGGAAVPPFSFRTLKDETPYDAKTAETVRSLSKMKYGRDVHAVRKKILERRHIWEKDRWEVGSSASENDFRTEGS